MEQATWNKMTLVKTDKDRALFYDRNSVFSIFNTEFTFSYGAYQFTSILQALAFMKAYRYQPAKANSVLLVNPDVCLNIINNINLSPENQQVWDNDVPKILYQIALERFKQHAHLSDLLFKTGDYRLLKLGDFYYGASDTFSPDLVSRYSGENIMGEVLEMVRVDITFERTQGRAKTLSMEEIRNQSYNKPDKLIWEDQVERGQAFAKDLDSIWSAWH